MFEFLKKFSLILVSGPQRSGTRICARMIEHDTGHEYVDESDFCYRNLDALSKIIAISAHPLVIHCPAISQKVHRFSKKTTAIVFVIRPINEILASQERIGWDDARELRNYGRDSGVISEIKYANWLTHQKPITQNAYEIYYKDLKEHSMWVGAEQRKEFAPHQWREK